jgi:hypothetical protein
MGPLLEGSMRQFALACFFLAVTSFSARADEGMWLYNQLPKAQLKAKYGFEPTDAWAEHAMKSSVRFNSGGSGSFISPNGLVLTNHHVAADTLYKLSTAQNNLLENGFLARTEAEELKAPDLELNQLVSIEDVTTRVNAAVTASMTVAEAAAARRTVIAQVEKESFDKTGLRSDVVTLYRGGAYHLYRYKKYTDVRVVFAPEAATAFFGGDPDNFEYPRYDLDMTILRVYENDKPAQTPNYFKWSKAGAADGELVFVSGHPGRTNRMFTTEALLFLRDYRLPYTLDNLRHKEILLQQYGVQSAEQARQAKDELFYVQNSRKANLGMLKGLQDPSLIAAKQRAEYRLRALVEANPALKGLSTAWETVSKAQVAQRKLYVRFQLLEKLHGFDSTVFKIARHLVRLADEDVKKNEDRLAEYRDSGRASLEQELFSEAPLYLELETAKLAGSFSYLMQHLGEQNPLVRKVLQGKEPEARAAELLGNTVLFDTSVRRLLAKGGKKAIKNSYDPMILLARDVDRAMRAIRKQFEEQVDEVEQQAYGQIAQAIFAVQGTGTYPDATFTLRLAYGVVKGYQENGKTIAPWTTIGGAFEHEAAHGAVEPWKLPKSWHDAKSSLDLSTPFNFVSTADIIGGNSGSPVFNQAGEIVGLIFDGNIQSLPSNYTYTDSQARAVSVHSSAIREAVEKVYGATELVKEFAP